MKKFIVGHKNPDTDSVVSAIGLVRLKEMLGEEFESSIAGEVNKETALVLEKFGFEPPKLIPNEEKKVVLVDHNEPSQISENIENEEIEEIFDHHKLGGLSIPSPIFVNIKPVGSTSTIVAQLCKDKNVELKKDVASILLAGVISDTLNFNSPTTTNEDKNAVDFLNKIARLDVNDLASEMFKAKSDLTGTSADELINADYKEFNIKDKKIGVGVFETVSPDPVLGKKGELLKALEEKKQKEGLDYLYFAIIDIISKKAYFVIISKSEEDLLKKALGGQDKKGYFIVSGIVSRKKQIIPAIEGAL